jgi:hypothetical protein
MQFYNKAYRLTASRALREPELVSLKGQRIGDALRRTRQPTCVRRGVNHESQQ